MTQQKYLFLLKLIFKIAFFYMILDMIVHFSGVRLWGLTNFYPLAIIQFTELFMLLWASSSFIWLILFYEFYKRPELNKHLLPKFTLFCFIHGLILIYISRIPYETTMPTQASCFWIPFYSWWLRLEALEIISLGAFLSFGLKKKYL